MSQDVKQTRDAGQIKTVIEKLYTKMPVNLADKTGVTPVKVIGYNHPIIEIESQEIESPGRILTLIHGSHQMYLECAVLKKTEKQTELLKPARLIMQAIAAEKLQEDKTPGREVRKEKRVNVENKDSYDAYIHNCLPLNSIPDTLASINKKREAILTIYTNALNEKFHEDDEIQIELRCSNRLDKRMRIMNLQNRPILAPHIQKEEYWKELPEDKFISYEDFSGASGCDDLIGFFHKKKCIPDCAQTRTRFH